MELTMDIRGTKEIKLGYRRENFISTGKIGDSCCFHINWYKGIVGKQAKPLAVDLAFNDKSCGGGII